MDNNQWETPNTPDSIDKDAEIRKLKQDVEGYLEMLDQDQELLEEMHNNLRKATNLLNDLMTFITTYMTSQDTTKDLAKENLYMLMERKMKLMEEL